MENSVDNKFLFSKKDIAKIFDVQEKAVYKWVQNGCPTVMVGKSKKYNIVDVVKWRIEKTGAFTNIEGDIENLSVLEQSNVYKRDKLRSEAKLKDMEVKVTEGLYIPREEVVRTISDGFIMFKKSLLNLTNKVISELSIYIPADEHRQVSDILDNLIKDCLNTLSEGTEYA